MRRTSICLLLTLIIGSGSVFAANPVVFQPGSGHGVPAQGGRDVLWSQPGLLDGNKISSEIINDFGLVTEVAGDFVLDCDGGVVITSVTWWGGQWGWTEYDPICTLFNLILYAEDPSPDICAPVGDPVGIYFDVIPSQTDLDDNPGDFDNLFRYDLPIEIALDGGVRYWLTIQAADHSFPGQWGRLEAVDTQGCESCFRSEFFSFPEWATLTEVTGVPTNDASLELGGYCGTVPVRPSTWGSIRGLYR
jgi:hypothetical protein